MHVWAIDMHVQLELLADAFDILQALLEVRACATDPNGCLVLDQGRRKFSQCANDAFEC